MSKNENPFAIRRSPVEIIRAQTVTMEDYIEEYLDPDKRCTGSFDKAC